ncbi:hypothetical protein [uncultured Clostridium sp.]|uniref:lipopolysaccharide biosynthesis protein n=1 Tax=uncultured Clostridium sp. TaxID=59620 RepID=UPI0025ED1F18|nr:hypothetical protein [uncultured Clostridium sp.]MDU4323849.1 hypothetical protein [Clostridium celatum]
MNNNSRTRNSLINMGAAFGNQLLITLLSLISRTVFITALGSQYLGINGLFTNILSIISLAESGIGSSIIFSLYKPVAENDEEKILVLMNLYKKAFRVIALIVFLLGILMMPFLKYMMNDGTTVNNIYLIYLIFVINSASSYLFSYKISFLNVSQKNYIPTNIYSIFSIIAVLLKIVIIYFTKNYILYLIVDSIITIISSITVAKVTDRMYPFLKRKTNEKLDRNTKNDIVKNVKALIIHNIGGRVVFGTDNLLISSFVSVVAVGLYSNYNMLINIAKTFINTIFNSIEHSVGNLIAEEDNKKVYQIFKITMFCNFWIYSFFAIAMYICLEPAINVWIGKEYLMGKEIVGILMISFYISGMRRSIITIKSKAGIFHEDRFAPLFEAAINLIGSIILVKLLGISGIFIGTIISTLAVPFWLTPKIVYKKVFNLSCINYFKDYFIYAVVSLITCITTNFICSFTNNIGIVGLISKMIICTILPNLIYIIIFHKKDEFLYLYKLAYQLVISKIKINKKIGKQI